MANSNLPRRIIKVCSLYRHSYSRSPAQFSFDRWSCLVPKRIGRLSIQQKRTYLIPRLSLCLSLNFVKLSARGSLSGTNSIISWVISCSTFSFLCRDFLVNSVFIVIQQETQRLLSEPGIILSLCLGF